MNHKSFLPVFRLFGPWATSSSFCFRESCFTFASRLIASSFVSNVSYHTSRTGRRGFVCFASRARNCARSPAFPDHSSTRSKAFRPNTPEDMCSSSAVLSFSGSGTRALPARAPRHDLPILRVPSFYILCKRQWDHGIHYRPPKASACGIYMKASGCPVLL